MREALLAWGVLVCGCGAATPPPAVHASEVDHPVLETTLPVVRLTPEAVTRLGVETTEVQRSAFPMSRLVGGEVVVPSGRAVLVTAPVAGLVRFVAPLAPGSSVRHDAAVLRLIALAPTDRDTRARVAREVAAAEANLSALELRVARNQSLLEARSGSARALEEAVAARDVAKADVETARARAWTLAKDPLLSDVALAVRAPATGVVRVLAVAEGQTVPAGAPLLEVVAVDALQVRGLVFSGDLGRPASVPARFTAGPPTAEPDRATVDRYLTLPGDAGFAPGERVLVELPLGPASEVASVPASALVFDAWGGAWVYRCEGGRYSRARVDPARRVAERVVLARGPPVGSCVVSVGAAELFGAEFPPGH